MYTTSLICSTYARPSPHSNQLLFAGHWPICRKRPNYNSHHTIYHLKRVAGVKFRNDHCLKHIKIIFLLNNKLRHQTTISQLQIGTSLHAGWIRCTRNCYANKGRRDVYIAQEKFLRFFYTFSTRTRRLKFIKSHFSWLLALKFWMTKGAMRIVFLGSNVVTKNNYNQLLIAVIISFTNLYNYKLWVTVLEWRFTNRLLWGI